MENIGHNQDAVLAGKISRGDRAAYEELFLRYAPGIYRFSLSFFKEAASAEELVQDVFLKIWEKRENLDQTGNIRAFIFKVAVNAIYDYMRRKNIERAFQDYTRLNNPSGEDSTWHSLIFEEMKQQLGKLLLQLPEQQRQVFTLNRLDGLTNDEIAGKLNLSKRTVENHLYRALLFLKEHFNTDTLPALLFFCLFVG